MNKPIITVENLSKKFMIRETSGKLFKDLFFPDKKIVCAVNDISFDINMGESVAFLGPNGAGKTTTTKMLTGLIYPTRGEISVMGYYPFDRKKAFLRKIGLIMGNKVGLNWDLTPKQSFELLRKIYQISDKEFNKRLENLTSLLQIGEFLDVQVRKLSLGERMKMELIGAILHAPEVLFLDEPTIGLDIISKQSIRKFLRQIQREFKTTILLTSHDMDDIETVSDRVIILAHGEILYDNNLESLIDQYKKTRYVKFIFKKKPELKEIRDVTLAEIYLDGENFYAFEIENSIMPKLIFDMNDAFGLHDVDIEAVPLEEIIRDIFEKDSG